MSQRGKRQPNRTDDGPVATKRRKCRPSAAEEEAAAMAADGSGSWTPRPLTDLKMPSIYNRSTTEAPAELFRKDLISAMKLPDSEPLSLDEYWVITDQWKQEWERGVQVPVNPDSLPEPTVTVNHCASNEKAREFKLPKSKYIRITKDENFTSENHFLSNTPAKAEKACSYDLDESDAAWLRILNGERASMGLQAITDDQLERVIEELEVRCWEKVQTIVKTEEGLGIEYDENVICDVCRSPDSEEGNEMVFCDSCNICVHQACYGITTIPSGSWLCRTCALGQRPECVLCPNKGGAMKCTRSGQKWAHVSCALWIPEVSIGCVERMEPITKISSIPQSRWALICVLCRERVGACIQCSVKTCKTAYHVTCAFKHGLEMRAIIEDENADDGVKLRSYCQKHSVTSKKEKCGSQSEEDESRRRKRKDMTSEEKNLARAAKLLEIEAEFDKHVSVKDVTQPMDVDPEGVQYIYNYWKLKRRAGYNKPLLPPKSEDIDMLSHQQEQADIEKMKMFVQLRQDLERVRNLCYMVSRREKLSRSFFRMREQTFHKQAAVLSDAGTSLKVKEVAAVIEANHGPSIYDRLYSDPSSDGHGNNFELVLARIAGTISPPPSEDKPKPDLNGLVKCETDKKGSDNPYKRLYFNGASRRRSSLYGSMSSGSETDAGRTKLLGLPDSASSSQDEEEDRDKSVVETVVKKKSKNIKKSVVSRTKVDTTSEEDENPSKSVRHGIRSRSLRHLERELASASDDSDELIPIKTTKNEPHKVAFIYSDSDSELSMKEGMSDDDRNEDKSSTPSDSQPFLRTKAAMKEFSAGLQAKGDKAAQKNASKQQSKSVKKPRERDALQDESMDDKSVCGWPMQNVKSSKKMDYVSSDLIVPQRQAAKKASESMRCSQSKSKDQVLFEQEAFKPTSPSTPVSDDFKLKEKPKHKFKELKEPRTPGKSNDIYDFEKETTSNDDASEILAYVPQRQAAKKAALHIKSGSSTKVVPADGVILKGVPDVTELADAADVTKQRKKLSKSPESKGKVAPKSRELVSSSNSSSSSGDSSSSSESDSEDKSKLLPKEKLATSTEKKSVTSSPNKDSVKKSKIPGKNSEDWPFLDKGDQSSRSSSTSTGSDSSDSDMFTRKKDSITSQKIATKSKAIGRSETKDLKYGVDEKKGGSSTSKLAGKKCKKAPDKKLKTSDGRPELDFQPPVIERDESSTRTKENLGRGRKSDGHKTTRPTDDGRPRALSVSKSHDHSSGEETKSVAKREHNASRSRNQSRTPRTEEQPKRGRDGEPNTERRIYKKDHSKNEGRARKSGDSEGPNKPANVRGEIDYLSSSSDTTPEKTRKEIRKSSDQPSSLKKADKKVDKFSEKKGVKEVSTSRHEKDSAERKISEKSPSKKNVKTLEKHDNKSDKLLGKKVVEHDSKPMLSKEDTLSKHAKSSSTAKRTNKDRDSIETEDVRRKDKSSGTKPVVEVSHRGSKHNSVTTSTLQKTPSKDETGNRKNELSQKSNKKYEEKLDSSKIDRKSSSLAPTIIDENQIGELTNEKQTRRESTESIASVSAEYSDDKSKKRGKAMPRCKKKALGISTDIKEIESVQTETTPMSDIKLEKLSQEGSTDDAVISLETPRAATPVVIKLDDEPVPSVSLPNAVTFLPGIPLDKLDLDHDFLVPDQEVTSPRKITSRTPSLTGLTYPQRSIFSPQAPKDPATAELFDFENDILAVDETVNDDGGFSIARDSEELMRPLTFSFSSDLLFKEESKEDSERETLNLVEKLRQQYAQKSTTGQPDGEDPASVAVEDDNPVVDEIPEEKSEEPIHVDVGGETDVKEDNQSAEVPNECSPRVLESVKMMQASTPIQELESQEMVKIDEQSESRNDNNYDYHANSVTSEVVKASIPNLEKLDRSNIAQDDERWVPPSMEFVQQQQHLAQQRHYESHPPLHDTLAQSPYTDHRSRAKWADSEVLPVRRSSSSSGSSSSSSSHREDIEPMKRDDFLYPHNPADLYQGMHPGIPSFPPCPTMTDIHRYHPYPEASPFVGPVPLFPPACAQLPFPSPGAGMYPPPFGPPFSTAHSFPPQMSKPTDEPHIPPPCSAAFTSSSHNMALIAAMVSQPPQMPTPVPPSTPSPIMHPEPSLTPASFPSAPEAMSPLQPNNNVINHHPGKDATLPKVSSNLPGKKSPTKPTRTSARVTSQLGKSPGKSPRQQEQIVAKSPARVRETSSKRGKGNANRGQNRGGNRRGRGRGRGQNMHCQDMDHNTIHSKLAGTVYDLEFDDDSPSESVESMRAMRERRRSTDVHDKKISDYGSHDSSLSPKFGSPPHQVHNSKMRYSSDVRETCAPSPQSGLHTPARDEELMPPPSPVSVTERSEPFPDVVRPLLPGPVDMRTYSLPYEPNPSNNPIAYHNHVLGQYATADAEQHVVDFVEEIEKELHTALAARKTVELSMQNEVAVPDIVNQMNNDASHLNMKVSLSDSRNQLKVKIKGPFLDANYSACSAPQQHVPFLVPPVDVIAASNAIPAMTTAIFSAASSSGTSNLRRMRKKELLRQYCSQDMNMVDVAGGAVTGLAMAPTTAPPINRTIITIPKAVASMTTIPTREDYKAVVDANMEKKRRKEKATLSSTLSVARELRHLDLSGLDDHSIPERRRSVGSTGSNTSSIHMPDTLLSSHPNKKRGRPTKPTAPECPVLKIKIGNSIMGKPEAQAIEEKKLRIRPPKKRLSSVPKPSMEEMKRESMKYRRLMYADFDQVEKKKRNKGGGKRKKRHRDSHHEVSIIATAGTAENSTTPKLIIRFNKRINSVVANPIPTVEGPIPPPPVDVVESRTTVIPPPSDATPVLPPGPEPDKLLSVDVSASVGKSKGPSPLLKVRTSKVTPIRLKLARCNEGYMMKTQPPVDPLATNSTTPPTINDTEQALSNSSSVLVNKGCEVR